MVRPTIFDINCGIWGGFVVRFSDISERSWILCVTCPVCFNVWLHADVNIRTGDFFRNCFAKGVYKNFKLWYNTKANVDN